MKESTVHNCQDSIYLEPYTLELFPPPCLEILFVLSPKVPENPLPGIRVVIIIKGHPLCHGQPPCLS